MISLTNDILVYLGNFIESPSDIIKCREVSKLFKERVSEVALRAFFSRNQGLIEHTGFRFSTDLPCDNFRSLFFLAAKILNRRVSGLDKLLIGLDRLMISPHIQFPRIVLRTQWVAFKHRDLNATNSFWEWIRGLDDGMKSIQQISYKDPSDLSFIPHEIVVLKSLVNFTLSNSRLTYVPAFLAQLTELQFLVLYGNRIDSVFCDFSQMPKLKYLDVSGNQLDVLPSPELLKREECLCMRVDAETLLNSKDVLDHYSSVFFIFFPPPVDASFTAEFFNSVMFHNSRVFQKFSEGIIDTDEEIDIDAYNDMLDWTQLGTHKKEFPIDSLERRMQSGMKYLSELMPSRLKKK